MKLFHQGMKMAEVIYNNYLLLPVINRFGIKPGFGDKTIKVVCEKTGINTDFFLCIINTFNNEKYFPEKKLQTFNVLIIVDYLKKTHSFYKLIQIPLIENHLLLFLESYKANKNTINQVRKFFNEYKYELIEHLNREENNTFPYVEKVYHFYKNMNIAKSKEVKNLLAKYSMKIFENEHNNIDEKLEDLKNILIKYIEPDFNENLCNILIFELFRLEKDLVDHTRIEENIMKPLVIFMEKELKLKYKL